MLSFHSWLREMATRAALCVALSPCPTNTQPREKLNGTATLSAKKRMCQQVAQAVIQSVLKIKYFVNWLWNFRCLSREWFFHFCIWSKTAIKLRSWIWCWRSEMLGLFSCQASVKNETRKMAVVVIVWFRYYRACPAWNVHISNLSSFIPTGLLFVRRSLQQSVPRNATAAVGVAADGSTCLGLKPARRLLKCSAWWWCKEGLRYHCGNDMFVVIIWINVISKQTPWKTGCTQFSLCYHFTCYGCTLQISASGFLHHLVRWAHLTCLHSTTKNIGWSQDAVRSSKQGC